MFVHYLKIALRNITRNKLFSIINISGLAIGMACSLLIMLYVYDELSYDRFHKNADNIYRVVTDTDITQSGLVADVLSAEIPEVKNVARFYATNTTGRNGLIRYGDKGFYSDALIMADPGFFDLFTFRFIRGKPEESLKENNSIVITRETASKFFGNDDPMGKILVYENQLEFQVTGVLEDIPQNSHLKFDFVIPLENYRTIRESPHGLENWYNNSFVTYTVLQRNADPTVIASKLQKLVENRVGEKYFPLRLQRLTDIHLHSHFKSELDENNDITSIYIYSTIALFLLLIACINYINLSTTQSFLRAREIGIRKAAGAYRMQLIRQFLGESILFSTVAVFLAIIIVELSLPSFNELTNKKITLQSENTPFLISSILGIIFGVGLLAGGYLAFVLSAFDPVNIIKGIFPQTGSAFSGTHIRSFLIVAQFVLSIMLITGAIVIAAQLDFIQNKNPGFTKEQVIAIPTYRSMEAVSKILSLKDKIQMSASIYDVTASSNIPGSTLSSRTISEGGISLNDELPVQILMLDNDFFKAYKIGLVAGRTFLEKNVSDEKGAIILNETAVKELGIFHVKDAIGKTIWQDTLRTIIGVVKDFNFTSFHEKIPPIIMRADPRRYSFLSARISTQNIPATIAFIKEKWHSVFPNRPFEYYFVDKKFDLQYNSEQRMSKLFNWFSALAIIIACLGLFSLVSLTISLRTKEIGIRKILGASTTEVYFLLSKEFFIWVIISNVIAWLASWYFMNKWLEDFAYRIELRWWMFALSGIIVLFIAVVTVSFQAIKAANVNPVKSLKYE